MPISFEQPEPFSASASMGYGAAQSSDRALPVLAGLQEAAARNYLARQQMAQQFAESGADRQMQMNMFTAKLNQHAGDTGADRTLQDEMGRAQMQNRMDLQQQAAGLDVWQRGQALTQAENLRLQRMKSGVAEIDATPYLSGEEKTLAKLKLRTGIDAYEQRNQASMTKQHEMQTKAMMEQRALISQLNSTDEAVRTRAFSQRVINDPVLGKGWIDSKGDFQAIKTEKIPEFDSKHALEVATAHANAAFPITADENGKKGLPSAEHQAYVVKKYDEFKGQHEEKYKTPQQRAAEHQAAVMAEAAPEKVARKMGGMDAAMSMWSERTDVDDQTKRAAMTAIQQSKLMISQFKTPALMPAPMRAKYEQFQAFLSTLPAAAAAPLAPSGNRVADINATGTPDNRLPDLGVTGSDFGSAGMN